MKLVEQITNGLGMRKTDQTTFKFSFVVDLLRKLFHKNHYFFLKKKGGLINTLGPPPHPFTLRFALVYDKTY